MTTRASIKIFANFHILKFLDVSGTPGLPRVSPRPFSHPLSNLSRGQGCDPPARAEGYPWVGLVVSLGLWPTPRVEGYLWVRGVGILTSIFMGDQRPLILGPF